MAADISTWIWVSLWAVFSFRLYSTLAAYAEVGRTIERGGNNIKAAGSQVGDSLGGIPLIGAGVSDLTKSTFGSAGQPFIAVGGELEDLLLLIAALLGLVVLAVTLIPWLTRYLPWRARRLYQLRTAQRAIREAPTDVPKSTVDRLLASRAINHLTYGELLEHTPDPIGDFTSGRHDRLARAELESVGLRP